MRTSLLFLVVLFGCGGPAPTPDVPGASGEIAPANPTVENNPATMGPKQACADIEARLATARKVEISLQQFAGEDGFGEAWVDEQNNVLKLVGSLAAESHNREIEFHYADGAPVCLRSTTNHYNKPSYEDGGGEVDGSEVVFRVFKDGVLVLVEHDGKPLAIASDTDAGSEADEARSMAEHAKSAATGESD